MLARLAGACNSLGYYNSELCAEVARHFQQQLQLQIMQHQHHEEQQGRQGGFSLQQEGFVGGFTGRREAGRPLAMAISGADVATLCYSLAQLGHRSPALFDAAVEHGLRHRGSHRAAALVRFTRALVLSEHHREDWLEMVGEEGLQQLPKLSSDEVSSGTTPREKLPR
jgi:hypothetical protein